MRRYDHFWTRSIRALFSASIAAVGIHFAAAQVFFGEDINTTPLGQNVVPPGPRANADATFAAFIASSPSYGVEDFESFTPFTSPNFTIGVSFPSTSLTGTLSLVNGTNYTGIILHGNPIYAGAYPSSGTKFLFMNSANIVTVTVTFSAPVQGVGFYGTDVELTRPIVRLIYTDSSTEDFVVNATVYPSWGEQISGNIFFWGYKTTSSLQITQMQIIYSANGDGIGIDDITVLVPEPASLIALGAGLAGLVHLRRRRR
jgi:hypothetical protein